MVVWLFIYLDDQYPIITGMLKTIVILQMSQAMTLWSMNWGEKWLFYLLILVEMLTITV